MIIWFVGVGAAYIGIHEVRYSIAVDIEHVSEHPSPAIAVWQRGTELIRVSPHIRLRRALLLDRKTNRALSVEVSIVEDGLHRLIGAVLQCLSVRVRKGDTRQEGLVPDPRRDVDEVTVGYLHRESGETIGEIVGADQARSTIGAWVPEVFDFDPIEQFV